jgi:curved DNA-binding protein CbpA
MADPSQDYYEVLQVSANADPDTIHRVYRLLAQRFHPDNQETGNSATFQLLTEAYQVLSNPERRAQYDATYRQGQQTRWRLVSTGAKAENDFEIEQAVRLTVLECLYTQRRVEPQSPGLLILELERLLDQPREHLEFTVWYLAQKKYIAKADNARLVITAEGAEHLEQNYQANVQRRLLRARNPEPDRVPT